MRLNAPLFLVFLALAGCAASPPAESPTATATQAEARTPTENSSTVPEPAVETTTAVPEPPVQSGALTIEEVWEVIGCDAHDPFSRVNDADLPLLRQGACYPYGGDEPGYFFELPSAGDVDAYLRSGELEVDSGDALYVDGAVIILATDAATAQRLGEVFTPVQ